MPGISLNVPHYKQECPYSCVAACVRMVLAQYGRICSEDDLRHVLGTGPHGTAARAMLRLFSWGFDVELRSATLADLGAALSAGVPPIVFLDTGFLDYWSLQADHVAVVVGLDVATVLLSDPFFDTASQQTSLSGFMQAWAANQYFTAFVRLHP